MIRRMAALTAGLLATGCAYTGGSREFRPAELDREAGWIAVRGVPEIRQRKPEDCGIAALAMVLAYWKTPAPPDEIEAACPAVPGKGSRAGDLRDFARRKGLQAFLLRGGPADFRKELGRGRPLLVGVIKPYAAAALSHYEVVVAWHPERRIVVTLDPARGWRQSGWEDFIREWDPAQRLLLVVFPGREKVSSSHGAGRRNIREPLSLRLRGSSSPRRHEDTKTHEGVICCRGRESGGRSGRALSDGYGASHRNGFVSFVSRRRRSGYGA